MVTSHMSPDKTSLLGIINTRNPRPSAAKSSQSFSFQGLPHSFDPRNDFSAVKLNCFWNFRTVLKTPGYTPAVSADSESLVTRSRIFNHLQIAQFVSFLFSGICELPWGVGEHVSVFVRKLHDRLPSIPCSCRTIL